MLLGNCFVIQNSLSFCFEQNVFSGHMTLIIHRKLLSFVYDKVLFQHHISSHEATSFQEIIQEVEGVVIT